jgi:hypothetical protein
VAEESRRKRQRFKAKIAISQLVPDKLLALADEVIE